MKRLHDLLDQAAELEEPIKRPRKEIPTVSLDESEASTVHEEEEDVLSVSQQEALDLVIRGKNVFITGGAGSGKSHLIQHIQQALDTRNRKYVLTATTGVAAWHIQGITLHSFAGIDFKSSEVEACLRQVLKNELKTEEWRTLDVLIVDEVSMLNVQFFEVLALMAQGLRKNNRPFGGIQLVLIGDYFQCPPILEKKPGDKNTGEIKFLFDSYLWRHLQIQTVKLAQNFRQSDEPLFQDLLNNIRLDKLTNKDKELLTTRHISVHRAIDQKNLIKLCSYRQEAERINLCELGKLPGEARRFTGELTLYDNKGCAITPEVLARMTTDEKKDWENRRKKTSAPVDFQITLKVGALVLLACNMDVKEGLYNGARGKVISFKRAIGDNKGSLYPVVEFENGKTLTITPHTWETKKNHRRMATFYQVPLILRYAMTIHKVQGLTLEKVLITMNFFDAGLGYVAFSRVRRLDDLYLSNIDLSKIKTDPAVLKFYTDNKLL